MTASRSAPKSRVRRWLYLFDDATANSFKVRRREHDLSELDGHCPKCGHTDWSYDDGGKDVWDVCTNCGWAELWAGGQLIAQRESLAALSPGGQP